MTDRTNTMTRADCERHRAAVDTVLTQLEEERECVPELLDSVGKYWERLVDENLDREAECLSVPITSEADLAERYEIIARYAGMGLLVSDHVERLISQETDWRHLPA